MAVTTAPRSRQAPTAGPVANLVCRLAHPAVTRLPVCTWHRYRRRRHRGGARTLGVFRVRVAGRDKCPRDEPAHRHKRSDPLWRNRRAAHRRPGDDRPDRPGLCSAVHRVYQQCERLSQPTHPRDRHQRPLCRRGEPRPALCRRDQDRRGHLSECRHRHRAGLRSRRGGRPAPRNRRRLPRRAHLARRHVVLRRRDIETGVAHTGDRLRGSRRFPGRREIPRL